MPSIRKTKKRLKRKIAELWSDFDYVDRNQHTAIGRFLLCGAIYKHIELLERELQNLKRKKQ